MIWSRICRLLGLAAIAFIIICLFTPFPNFLARQLTVPSQPGSADAIVVLGSGMQSDGTLGPRSFRRAIHGIVLHQRGLARFLVFCGSSYRGNREAEVRAALARELGITPDVILTETRAL
ncbi:MAG: YdcF family protein, partial [Gammaproteobacteria bacterium]